MTDGGPITILLVEDDPAHAGIVRRNLEDFRVANRMVHMEDGQAAYAAPQSSPRPSLILLDLRLQLKSVPAVVLTTSAAESDRVGAYGNGAGSWLGFPD